MAIAIICGLLIAISFLVVKLKRANAEIEGLRNMNQFDLNKDGQVNNSDLSEYMSGYNKRDKGV